MHQFCHHWTVCVKVATWTIIGANPTSAVCGDPISCPHDTSQPFPIFSLTGLEKEKNKPFFLFFLDKAPQYNVCQGPCCLPFTQVIAFSFVLKSVRHNVHILLFHLGFQSISSAFQLLYQMVTSSSYLWLSQMGRTRDDKTLIDKVKVISSHWVIAFSCPAMSGLVD